MTKLTETELRLYQTSIESLNNRYAEYIQFDLQVCDSLDFDNLDIDDLRYLFGLSKYGTELCQRLSFEITLRKINNENINKGWE